MDLHSIESVLMPRTRAELPAWSAGTAVLGGGTWLFSEKQPHLRRLIDLTALEWENLTVDGEGLHVAGTCTISALSRFAPPVDWRAGDLIGQCCEALLGSFKVWNAATVGGNICLALPAGPMIALAAALGGIATVWRPDGGEQRLPVMDLVLGERRTALADGEILRSVLLPRAALQQRCAFRRISLTPLGLSAALDRHAQSRCRLRADADGCDHSADPPRVCGEAIDRALGDTDRQGSQPSWPVAGRYPR
jgi:CO/xanthine dehydrogenase FAD-binding subunit